MEAPAPEDTMVGGVLADKYRVVRQIGRGGMGVVYEAEHIGLGKRVAIKLMLEKYAKDGEATKRFHREALAASRIGNPHIIDVSDIGTAPDGRSFVVMELLNGQPLTDVIEAAGFLPPWRAVHIMRQVLRAVGAAHAKGIVHRDLKPDNIFIVNQDDHHDFVKLLDFGISKMLDPEEQVAFTKLTTTGVVMGTPLYMAPEQAMGHATERHADIYACGVILYEMLAGKPPFDGATYAVLVAKLLTQQPPLLADARPGLPATLVRAVHRALEKEPEDRFASAEQFAAALPGEKTPSMLELAGTLDSASGAVAVSPPTERRRVRKWPVLAASAAVVVAVAVGAVLFLQRDHAPPTPPAPVAASAQAAAQPDSMTVAPAPPPEAVGILQVKTVPPGATVSIDDDLKGPTPIEITLTAGRHRVQVALDGYDTIESEEDVRDSERGSVVLQLQKSTKPVATRPGKKPGKDVRPAGKAEPTGKASPSGPDKPVDKPIDKPADKPIDKPIDKPVVKPDKTVKPGAKPNPY